MASYTELELLREEEKVLMKISTKLGDQLNRLKVNLTEEVRRPGSESHMGFVQVLTRPYQGLGK